MYIHRIIPEHLYVAYTKDTRLIKKQCIHILLI